MHLGAFRGAPQPVRHRGVRDRWTIACWIRAKISFRPLKLPFHIHVSRRLSQMPMGLSMFSPSPTLSSPYTLKKNLGNNELALVGWSSVRRVFSVQDGRFLFFPDSCYNSQKPGFASTCIVLGVSEGHCIQRSTSNYSNAPTQAEIMV